MPIYQPINGYPDYQIGDDGTVIGKKGALLRPNLTSRGLLQFKIRSTRRYVHVVVGETFVPGRTPERKHLVWVNGNRLDNSAENLRWVTRTEQIRVRQERDGFARGEKRSKQFTYEIVEQIRRMSRTGTAARELARVYETAESTIRHILKGRTWTKPAPIAIKRVTPRKKQTEFGPIEDGWGARYEARA